MANAIKQLPSGLTIGTFGLGARGGVAGSVKQEVHDGDTVIVRATDNFGFRFLGVDAPEISFTLPGQQSFTGLADPRWEQFLTDPLATWAGPILEQGLRTHLAGSVGAGTALNHHRHAASAEDALEAEIAADLQALGKTADEFRFFVAFAEQVMDRYGRLLAYINRDQPDEQVPGPRPPTYNERLLQGGLVVPYFIWPNLDPFLDPKKSTVEKVVQPGAAPQLNQRSPKLAAARAAIGQSRQQATGIFAAGDPLRLMPFELRFLARGAAPDRWVIDLTKANDVLIPPQRYHTIPNVEDRLFIPAEYVPLFESKGWQRQP